MTTSPVQSSELTEAQRLDSPELGRAAFSSWPEGRDGGARPAGWYRLPLPAEAAAFYQENGFLVVEDCLSQEEVRELKAETAAICRGERGEFGGQLNHEADESDDDVMSQYLCLHFPHKISSTMHRATAHPTYAAILSQLIGPNVKCMQSMLFVKSAGKPGQAWHQDEYYIPTRDRSLTGGWLALDDASVENGCLWVIPGSHRRGILFPQEKHQDRRFDCAGESKFPYTVEDSVPVEVKAGSIVFFNGYLLHRSLPNHSATGYRRCLVNHYMSAESFLPWGQPKEGETMATADYRDVFMIAGEDPYAWKGTVNDSKVFVRPSGKGGCGNPETYKEEEKAKK